MPRTVRAFYFNDDNEEIEIEADLNDDELIKLIDIFDTALERD